MLKEYADKRRLGRTPEPLAKQPPTSAGPPIFVVQKHAARQLHYDFRLEVDGVLKSWSVPQGPSLDPDVKRLAVMVEDHPTGYASFEGVIPKGEYGAGQVVVWDHGDYIPQDEGRSVFGEEAMRLARDGLARGKLSFLLRGHKLKGSWALVKMKRGDNNWLLIKHRDDFADTADVLEKRSSVISGLTIEDLKAGRELPPADAAAVRLSELSGARMAPFPAALRPMLASSADAPFSAPGWLFEPKLDGYRIIATLDSGKVSLVTRGGMDVAGKYADVAEAVAGQPAARLVLDGEVIGLDENGEICFQCLQNYLEFMQRLKAEGQTPVIIYYVFDIFHLDGYDLCRVPLWQRKRVLSRVLQPSRWVRPLDYFEGDGIAIYRGAVAQGLEGVIAKRKDSIYEPGRRSPDWLKVKSMQTDDFIIGGYTRGAGARAGAIGALLLGYYDEQGRLQWAGHVGSGFNERLLTELKKRLDALKTRQCPFAEIPEVNAPARWVRPELVAEVKFSEWTRDGRLRTPVFLRLRDDKPADQVRLTQSVVVGGQTDAKPAEDAVTKVLKQLAGKESDLTLEVEDKRVKLSSLDKELWPPAGERPGVTKRDLLVYLAKASPCLLRHLRDRPITLSRYPDGITGEHFFQKHWGFPVPDFVATVQLSEHRQKPQEYLLCNNLSTLLWLGQVADLEIHSWFSRISPEPDMEMPDATSPEAIDLLTRYPDFIVFDLDPYIYAGTERRGDEPDLSRKGFAATCEAALWVKETLDGLSLASFIKTSGMTGLHIYVPILRQLEYHAVASAAKTICKYVLQRHPKAVTTDWAVEKRTGRVFLDYNQNQRGKTLACAYSPRPSAGVTVSMPLRWDELGQAYPTDFTIQTAPDRLATLGDLWSSILDAKRDLRKLLKLG